MRTLNKTKKTTTKKKRRSRRRVLLSGTAMFPKTKLL
jgi:hypothetical protein